MAPLMTGHIIYLHFSQRQFINPEVEGLREGFHRLWDLATLSPYLPGQISFANLMIPLMTDNVVSLSSPATLTPNLANQSENANMLVLPTSISWNG